MAWRTGIECVLRDWVCSNNYKVTVGRAMLEAALLDPNTLAIHAERGGELEARGSSFDRGCERRDGRRSNNAAMRVEMVDDRTKLHTRRDGRTKHTPPFSWESMVETVEQRDAHRWRPGKDRRTNRRLSLAARALPTPPPNQPRAPTRFAPSRALCLVPATVVARGDARWDVGRRDRHLAPPQAARDRRCARGALGRAAAPLGGGRRRRRWGAGRGAAARARAALALSRGRLY